MPASSGDPIASSLKRTFSSANGSSSGHGLIRGGSSSSVVSGSSGSGSSSIGSTFESKLQNSARKGALLTNIQFDTPTRYVGSVLSSAGNRDGQPKSRFIILNPERQTSDGDGGKKEGSGTEQTIPVPKMVFCNLSSIEVGYKRHRSAGSGMFNVGNTCYLNSTLQALFHTPALFNYLTDSNHTSKCNGSTGLNGFIQNCTICAMTHTLRDTLRSNVIKPSRVYEKLKSICKHMVHGRQEDAHEFLRYLIEALQRSFLITSHAPKNIDNASKETTPFNQIFGGYMRQEVTCLKCRYVSTTFQHFMDILLDIRQVSNIEEALSQYFRQEKIGGSGDDGANMYKCEKCKVKVPAKKRYLIERPPAVLCIQLKRFSLLGGKISKPVQLSRKIDVSQYVRTTAATSGSNPVQYSLVAMITHVGPSPNCGHYTAIGEAGNGQYYQFDDSSVRPISVNQVLNTASYVVFYEMTRSSWGNIIAAAASSSSSSSSRSSSSSSGSGGSIKSSSPEKPCTVTTSTVNNKNNCSPSPAPAPPKSAAPSINFHRVNGGGENNKPKLLSLGSSASKLGIVSGVAKNAMASIVRSVTSVASTANGHLKKGLVPYDDDDSCDSDDAKSKPAATTEVKKNGVIASQFVPRAVTVKALATKNATASQPTPPSSSSLAAASSPAVVRANHDNKVGVERKSSCSGTWTVTDNDHHNPSLNSDNSTGSTTSGWVVKDKSNSKEDDSSSSSAGNSLKSSHRTGSAASNSSSFDSSTSAATGNGADGCGGNGLSDSDSGSLKTDNSQKDNASSSSTTSSLNGGSGRTKTTTEVDHGAFAKTFLHDTPRKRANGSTSSNRDSDDYDAELDRGRTKKVRKSDSSENNVMFNARSGYNPFQTAQNFNGNGNQHRRDRRSDSSSRYNNGGGHYPDSPRNRSLNHRDQNYHVDWARSNGGGGSGGKRNNNYDNNRDNGRRKSFSSSNDFRNFRNKSYPNYGGGGGGGGRNTYRGNTDGYRQSNENRDYYGHRHHHQKY